MEKILVADDEREIADLLEACLSAGGYEVFKCYSAADVRKAPLSEVSLAILDIMLPGEDGLSILKKLRENPETKSVPVIMVTAKGSEYDKVKGLDCGADDYITKPFGMMETVSRIKAVLRRAGRFAPVYLGAFVRAGRPRRLGTRGRSFCPPRIH